MEENNILKKRFAELADRAYTHGTPVFSDFLGLHEQSVYHAIEQEIAWVGVTQHGGTSDSERVMLGFGDDAIPAGSFPFVCIKAEPLQQKFADVLTHRDLLGALMHLGIERDKLGDIFILDNCAYFFCVQSLADTVCEGLTRAKHTDVRCQVVDALPDRLGSQTAECMLQVASERLDVLIAAVYRLSREKSLALFRQGKVFVNGAVCENNSATAPENAVISVRSFGRFRYCGTVSLSRKGKLNIRVETYVS